MDKDLNKEIEAKQQTMYLNKKIIDLEKSMSSLVDFYVKYLNNTVASEINNKICIYHGISPNSKQGTMYFNTITTHLFLSTEELKKILKVNLDALKAKLSTLSDEDYYKALNYLSTVVTNQMLDYYIEKLDGISNDLNQDLTLDNKNRINKFIFDTLTIKLINILKDKFMYAIGVIKNNGRENQEIMNTIKEKTINTQTKK